MRRIGTIVGLGMLLALTACTGGSPNTESPSPTPAPQSATPTSATTSLEGTWDSILNARELLRRGFSQEQIKLLQFHDEWSSRQENEITFGQDGWILSQGMDGDQPTPTNDFGHISIDGNRVRLDDGVCFLLLRYRLHGDELQMTLVRSTCDDNPEEPIPDYMYAAVFGQPYQREG